jgi:NADPH:quinone reductase-like Zn-dependent oxidoreductase
MYVGLCDPDASRPDRWVSSYVAESRPPPEPSSRFLSVMQAVVIEAHGGPEQLRLRQVADSDPGPGEVVVELRAAAVNRRDLLIRAGAGAAYRFALPLVLGSDGAGVRRDNGDEVVILPSLRWGPSELVAGPEFGILGGPSDGTYAELVTVPEANLFPRPVGLSWEQAAALPLAALTAFRALFPVGGLRRGERLVVLGVGSGVSLAAIQLARHAGASIAVTSSSSDKLERAGSLGADVLIDYREVGWADCLRAMIGGADIVLDSVGTTWPDSLAILKDGGRLVSCGGTGGGETTVDVRTLYLHQKRILGTKMGSPSDFRVLLDLVADRALEPIVDSVRPLADAASAHARMESNEHFGKLTLAIS